MSFLVLKKRKDGVGSECEGIGIGLWGVSVREFMLCCYIALLGALVWIV